MTKKIHWDNVYRGYCVNASKALKRGLYVDILDPIIDQLNALLSLHSRIHVLRVDLKFPSKWKINRKLENQAVSKLSECVKENLALKRWGGHKHVAYGWVYEVGKKNGRSHYHIFFAFKATTKRLGAVTDLGCTGLLGLVQDAWKRIVGGSIWYITTHTVNRGNLTEIVDCVDHLSYMAKVNTKVIGVGNTAKNWSFSRLK